MSEKTKTVTMESLAYHSHYDADGAPVVHDVGAIYDLHDGQGMTADELANSLEAMGVAKRSDGKATKKAKADEDDDDVATKKAKKR